MDISANSNLSFTSKLSPIKPFTINTKNGRLFVSEATKKDVSSPNFYKDLSKFFCQNFASNSNDPSWLVYNDPAHKEIHYAILDLFSRSIKTKLRENDNSLTILIAKDSRNKIQGACLSHGFDEVPASQETTCYIRDLAVNQKFRGFGVGKILLDKTLQSAQKTFTDVFLTGATLAEGFYKKLGFTHLNPENKHQRWVIKFLAQDRDDFPEYVKFLTKPLQNDKNRWYEASGKEIAKLTRMENCQECI
jgi:ribosomal protein S18 acetylase RimI-like enzyme